KTYSRHFPVNGVPDKPARFHDCRPGHKCGMAHRAYSLTCRPPHFHTVVHPCHADTEIHIDRDNIAQVVPVDKSWPPFAHYGWQIADRYSPVQPAIYAHRQYKTDRCVLCG